MSLSFIIFITLATVLVGYLRHKYEIKPLLDSAKMNVQESATNTVVCNEIVELNTKHRSASAGITLSEGKGKQRRVA